MKRLDGPSRARPVPPEGAGLTARCAWQGHDVFFKKGCLRDSENARMCSQYLVPPMAKLIPTASGNSFQSQGSTTGTPSCYCHPALLFSAAHEHEARCCHRLLIDNHLILNPRRMRAFIARRFIRRPIHTAAHKGTGSLLIEFFLFHHSPLPNGGEVLHLPLNAKLLQDGVEASQDSRHVRVELCQRLLLLRR